MDHKELNTNSPVSTSVNDGSTKYALSSPSLQASRNKSYDIGSNTLGKVDATTARPCAIIGPDRVLPSNSDDVMYSKKMPGEAWPSPENVYRRPPNYHSKMSDYQPTRNISPRQEFQVDMQRIMVPPTFSSIKSSDESNLKNSKLNLPQEAKYCDVPYNINSVNSEHKGVRNPDIPISNVNAYTRNLPPPYGWPAAVNVRPLRPYGAAEFYQYQEFPSCAGPRPLTMIRPHRPLNEESTQAYSERLYQDANIRFKPYPGGKEKHQQPRYDYISNYPSTFQPPASLPPHKYDLPKTVHGHPYPIYPQVAYKYLDRRIHEPFVDGYHRPHNQPTNFNTFHNQVVPPPYGPIPGNCMQNKPYSDIPSKLMNVNKLQFENNNKVYLNLDSRNKNYSDNMYYNDMNHSQAMRGEILLPTHSTLNIHPMTPHSIYRKDNTPLKSYEYNPNYRIFDQPMNVNSSLQRLPFSPNNVAISPSDSTNSNEAHTMSVSQEDCGYVSQSSTASIRSLDSNNIPMPHEFYRRHGYNNYDIVRNTFHTSSPLQISKNKISPLGKKNLNVRQFLQMWNEGDEPEITEVSKDTVAQSRSNNFSSQSEIIDNQEQLYVLGLVNVPNEELGKYDHIQKISKLPENIKGYNSIEILNQYEELLETPHVNNFNKSNNQVPREYNSLSKSLRIDTDITTKLPRPVSPLDVEAKISQSIIHKEVGCNFEIKPCSPEMLNVEVAAPMQTILGERMIEKVINPIMTKSPSIIKGDHIKLQNTPNNTEVRSCKMLSSQYTLTTANKVQTSNYNVQDLESNSSLCLASLPQLDNDIELNFPEINQQFIKANQIDSNIAPLPHLDLEQTHCFTQEVKHDILDNQSQQLVLTDKEFLKLSKYRKTKKCDITSSGNISKPDTIISGESTAVLQRIDSVIIKNPETIKSQDVECLKLSNEKYIEGDNCSETAIDFSLSRTENETAVSYFQSAIDRNVNHHLPPLEALNSNENKSFANDHIKEQNIETKHKNTKTPAEQFDGPQNENLKLNFTEDRHKHISNDVNYMKYDSLIEVTEKSPKVRALIEEFNVPVIRKLAWTESDTNENEISSNADNSKNIKTLINNVETTEGCLNEKNKVTNSKYIEEVESEISNNAEITKNIKKPNSNVKITEDLLNDEIKFTKLKDISEYKIDVEEVKYKTNENEISSNAVNKMNSNMMNCKFETTVGSLNEINKITNSKSISEYNIDVEEGKCKTNEKEITSIVQNIKNLKTPNCNVETSSLNEKIKVTNSKGVSEYNIDVEEVESKVNENEISNKAKINFEITEGLINDEIQITKSKDISEYKMDVEEVKFKTNENEISSNAENTNYIKMPNCNIEMTEDLLNDEIKITNSKDISEYKMDVEEVSCKTNENEISSNAENIKNLKTLSRDLEITEGSLNEENKSTNWKDIPEYKMEIEEVEYKSLIEKTDINLAGTIKTSNIIKNTNNEISRLNNYSNTDFEKRQIVNEVLDVLSNQDIEVEDTQSDGLYTTLKNDVSKVVEIPKIYLQKENENEKEGLNKFEIQSDEGKTGSVSQIFDDDITKAVSYITDQAEENLIDSCISNTSLSKINDIESNVNDNITFQQVSETNMDTSHLENLQSNCKENSYPTDKIILSNINVELSDCNEEFVIKSNEVQNDNTNIHVSKFKCLSDTRTYSNISKESDSLPADVDSKEVLQDSCTLQLGTTKIECLSHESDINCKNEINTCTEESKNITSFTEESRPELVAYSTAVETKYDSNVVIDMYQLACLSDKPHIKESVENKITNPKDKTSKNITVFCKEAEILKNDNHILTTEKSNLNSLDVDLNVFVSRVPREIKHKELSIKNYTSEAENPRRLNKPSLNIKNHAHFQKNLFSPWIRNLIIFTEGICKSLNKNKCDLEIEKLGNCEEVLIVKDNNFEVDIIKNNNMDTFKQLSCETNSELPSTNSLLNCIDVVHEDITYNTDSNELNNLTTFQIENDDNEVNHNYENFEKQSSKMTPSIIDMCTVVKPQKISKRSLSESAVEEFKDNANINFFRPQKRKKGLNQDFVESHMISEDICNIIHTNRRNSVSTFYHDDSVYIVINNDIVLTDETEAPEKICYTEHTTEECPTSVESTNCDINFMSEIESSTTEPNHIYEYSDSIHNIEEKSNQETWVEDVACIETVFSEDVAENIVIDVQTSPKKENYLHLQSVDEETNVFYDSDHIDKIKTIYGPTVCNENTQLIETLYRTPQMNVNKTLYHIESQDLEECMTLHIHDENKDSCSESNENIYSTNILGTGISSYKVIEDVLENSFLNTKQFTQNMSPIFNNNTDIIFKACSTEEQDKKIVTDSCESSNDYLNINVQKDNLSYSGSSSPEVSSTTSEEKNSSILLKITNCNGSRISQINEYSNDTRSKLSYKLTEKREYRSYNSNFSSSRTLITKGAQKYIPPLNATTYDLKVKLPLPEHRLHTLKQLKIAKVEPKIDATTYNRGVNNLKQSKSKKQKPKFEDVLKSIDEINFKRHKDKLKKGKHTIPKVVIKKNENGAHYTSSKTTSGKDTYNPDLTGRKWQPWVFLEKNSFIDKMALENKVKAIYCRRKNNYVFAEKFRKYKSVYNANFVISQPKANTSTTGNLKYTIRLKQT